MDTSATPHSPSMTARVVWLLFSFAMYAWAILGPLSIVIGTLSFFVEGVNFEGATPEEKLKNMGVAGILGAVGIGFAWLRWAGFLVFGDEIRSSPQFHDMGDWPGDGKRPDKGDFQAGEPPH
jgi:hypothetical protein